MDEVGKGRSLRQIRRKYKIPKTTLQYKNSGILKPIVEKPGPDCILGAENENKLVDWIIHVSDNGFPVTKLQLINSVHLLLKKAKKKTKFKNNRPGRHWYSAFLTRHPELSEKLSQNLLCTRASVTEEGIRGWFSGVKDHLESNNLLDIDGSRIFNCDESAFYLSPQGDKVLVKRGDKVAYTFVNNDEKECITTLFCGNAAGDLIPPMIMLNYVKIPQSVSTLMPKGWSIGRSESGWETAESFFEWVANIFYPWVLKKQIELPVILYVDGHSSHLTLELSNFCKKKGIVLVALHPNATHILQPMDVALFRPLKKSWKETVRDWRLENNGERLSRELFGGLLKLSLEKIEIKSILENGFRATGLHPFSADAVNYEKYFKVSTKDPRSEIPVVRNPSEMTRYIEFIEENIDPETN